MSELEAKRVCRCKNCGNEAEMEITCALPENESPASEHASSAPPQRVRGTATCTVCGNEADMWIDI